MEEYKFEHLAYYCVRIGDHLLHISKNKINGKIKWRITRTLVNSI